MLQNSSSTGSGPLRHIVRRWQDVRPMLALSCDHTIVASPFLDPQQTEVPCWKCRDGLRTMTAAERQRRYRDARRPREPRCDWCGSARLSNLKRELDGQPVYQCTLCDGVTIHVGIAAPSDAQLHLDF